jgi:ABC-type sugar transport system permease subunit
MSSVTSARGEAAGRRPRSMQQEERLLGYLLIVPTFFLIGGLLLYPAIWAVWLSFTDKVVGSAEQFVGLKNYIYILNWPDFGRTVWNTAFLAVVGVAIKALVGMTMALALNENFFGRNIMRGVLFLPWIVPSFVAGFIWRWLFDDLSGLFNWALLGLGLVKTPINFLGDPVLAVGAVMAVVVWKGFPFFGISYLAGLQAISNELYEAASIDGASLWQRFLFITMPGLRHVITVTCMLSLIWTANTFDLVYIMTGGGPSNATQVFTLFTFQLGIQNGRLGEAASVPMLAMPIFAGLIIILTRYLERE